MAITATENDGVSLTTDKISYDLVETDIEIITSGRRRIPAHSGVLVKIIYFFGVSDLLFLFWYFGVNFWLCLNLKNAGCRVAGTSEHHREAEEKPRRIIEESHQDCRRSMRRRFCLHQIPLFSQVRMVKFWNDFSPLL